MGILLDYFSFSKISASLLSSLAKLVRSSSTTLLGALAT